MADRQAYLDYGAATPVAPEVLEAMLPYLTERFHNPSAPYALARQARADLEAARASLARAIGAKPGQVTLTAGATEANLHVGRVATLGLRRGRGRDSGFLDNPRDVQKTSQKRSAPPRRAQGSQKNLYLRYSAVSAAMVM